MRKTEKHAKIVHLCLLVVDLEIGIKIFHSIDYNFFPINSIDLINLITQVLDKDLH